MAVKFHLLNEDKEEQKGKEMIGRMIAIEGSFVGGTGRATTAYGRVVLISSVVQGYRGDKQ